MMYVILYLSLPPTQVNKSQLCNALLLINRAVGPTQRWTLNVIDCQWSTVDVPNLFQIQSLDRTKFQTPERGALIFVDRAYLNSFPTQCVG